MLMWIKGVGMGGGDGGGGGGPVTSTYYRRYRNVPRVAPYIAALMVVLCGR